MAIHIRSGKNNISTELKHSKVQSLPFKIHADCDAKVNKYFGSFVETKEDTLTSSFRGYPLNGKMVTVPEYYVGIVLHESVQPRTEKDERNFYVVNNFDRLTFWNWNKHPSKNDSITQAMEWISIAEALHSPVCDLEE